MKSIIRTAFLLLISGCLHAQEVAPKRKIRPADAFIEITYAGPRATGTSYLSAATTLKGGAAIKAGYYFYDRFYLGGAAGLSGLDVTNTAIYGNAMSASISMAHLLVGYSYAFTDRFTLGADAGYGWIDFRNKFVQLDNRDVYANDSGMYFNGSLALDYKFTKDVAIIAGAAYQNNFMKIQTVPELQPLFDTAAFLQVHGGLRFYIR